MMNADHITLLTQAATVIRTEYGARMAAGNKLHELDPMKFPAPPASDIPDQIAAQLDDVAQTLRSLFRTGGPLS